MTLTIATLAAAGATALVFMLRRCLSNSAAISKARVDRAVSGMKTSIASSDSLPSILRTRYVGVGNRETLKSFLFFPIIRLNKSLEFLGFQVPLMQGFTIFFLCLCFLVF